MSNIQKHKRTKSKGHALVSSKIEDTKWTGLAQYRLNVASMSKKIKEYAVKLNPNLLSVKMALWSAAREVEVIMRERKKD